MKLALSNFGVQNTPQIVEQIGNFLLILAAIGVAILGLPASVPTLVLPPFLLTMANWFIAAGVIGKVITKFFGSTNPNDPPPVQK